MKSTTKLLIFAACAALALLNGSCSNTVKAPDSSKKTTLIGSTPGDPLINSLLGIRSDTVIDFIRWELIMDHSPSNGFELNINYGVSKPNTNGFMHSGEKRSIKGKYTASRSPDRLMNAEIYEFTEGGLPGNFLLLKLNDNLFHLLAPNNRLMVGNGGWSYSLNRKAPIVNDSSTLPALTLNPILFKDTANQVIFEGRTPCQEFAKEHNLQTSNDCIKIKWALTLNTTPDTAASGNYSLKAIAVPEGDKPLWPEKISGTYSLSGTLDRSRVREGKWEIIKGAAVNPELVLLILDPDKPDERISFLVGDENVLFLLDKEGRFFVGNSDFSFALNRRN